MDYAIDSVFSLVVQSNIEAVLHKEFTVVCYVKSKN